MTVCTGREDEDEERKSFRWQSNRIVREEWTLPWNPVLFLQMCLPESLAEECAVRETMPQKEEEERKGKENGSQVSVNQRDWTGCIACLFHPPCPTICLSVLCVSFLFFAFCLLLLSMAICERCFDSASTSGEKKTRKRGAI
jgi:hypothetical protein